MPPPTLSNDAFLAQLSFTTIRAIVITLCLLSLAGPILMIIGVGVLKAPDNFDARTQLYNEQLTAFAKQDSQLLLQSQGRLIQYTLVSSSSSSSAASTMNVSVVELLSPVPTNKPFPSSPELPNGNELIDTSVLSIPIESNASSTSIDRSLWSMTYWHNQQQVPATILNITTRVTNVAAEDVNENEKETEKSASATTTTTIVTSQIPLPPLLEPEVVSVPSTFCQPPAGEKSCTPERMQQLCQKESKCQNAKYNGTSCSAGKGCQGCFWTRYQTTVCIPVSLSREEKGKFVPSMKLKSCLYPFTSIEDETNSDDFTGYYSYSDKIDSINRRLRQITSCSLNISSSDENSGSSEMMTIINNKMPLKVDLMVDSDPFFVAQNMTRGTNVFAGLPLRAERDVGIGLLVGGTVLTLVVGVAWLSLQKLMKKDERTAKHVYRAFGQLYIPSTNDYVNAISQGLSYKHSNGFMPNNMNNNSNNKITRSTKGVYQPPETLISVQNKKFSSPVEFENDEQMLISLKV